MLKLPWPSWVAVLTPPRQLRGSHRGGSGPSKQNPFDPSFNNTPSSFAGIFGINSVWAEGTQTVIGRVGKHTFSAQRILLDGWMIILTYADLKCKCDSKEAQLEPQVSNMRRQQGTQAPRWEAELRHVLGTVRGTCQNQDLVFGVDLKRASTRLGQGKTPLPSLNFNSLA